MRRMLLQLTAIAILAGVGCDGATPAPPPPTTPPNKSSAPANKPADSVKPKLPADPG